MLRQIQEKSDLESAVQGERVKALEVEVERKSRTPVWDSAVWAGWCGWGARWEKGMAGNTEEQITGCQLR